MPEAPNSPNELSADKVDANKVNVESLGLRVAGNPNPGNVVTYTFKGTGEESFLHSLTYIPRGVIVTGQSKGASVSLNTTKGTARRAYMTSSVANNKVTLLFY